MLVDPAVPGMRVRPPDPALMAVAAALSIPGLVEAVLDRRFRQLGPERLVERVLALVCADPSRVDRAVVAAHVDLARERGHLGPQGSRAFVQASRSLGLRMADPRFWARVRLVQAPTLVIHGSLDRLIPLPAARELVRRRPDWKLEVIEGAGHVPMMETPDRFMSVLNKWMMDRIGPQAAKVS